MSVSCDSRLRVSTAFRLGLLTLSSARVSGTACLQPTHNNNCLCQNTRVHKSAASATTGDRVCQQHHRCQCADYSWKQASCLPGQMPNTRMSKNCFRHATVLCAVRQQDYTRNSMKRYVAVVYTPRSCYMFATDPTTHTIHVF